MNLAACRQGISNSFLLITILFLSFQCSAQSPITLTNPSFEGTPQQGVYGTRLPTGWYDCGVISFPGETAPDIHPKGFWENTLPASQGDTYIGMVVRDNESWESVSQKLSGTLTAGNCYEMSLELAQSANYWSGSRTFIDSRKKYNYTNPTVLRIWGGTNFCDTKELLAESDPVTNPDWMTYHFKITPKFDCRFIVFEAFYKTPTLEPYNGHILLDNISAITSIDCNKNVEHITDFERTDTIPLVVNVEAPIKKNNKPTSPKKPKKDKKDKKPKEVQTYTKKDKIKKKDYGTFSDIDLTKLKKNQIIKLEKLYFKADTTALDQSSYRTLDQLYNFLSSNKQLVIEVGGHTNSTPPQHYCIKLSTARAKHVADYLIEKGIPEDRILYKGYGKLKPVASNRTKSGRKMNQRVEIKIIEIR